jgi:hypothetical protein
LLAIRFYKVSACARMTLNFKLSHYPFERFVVPLGLLFRSVVRPVKATARYMLATKEQLTPSLKAAIKAGTRRRPPTSCTPSISRKRDVVGYRLRADGKGHLRIEILAFRGVFRFT